MTDVPAETTPPAKPSNSFTNRDGTVISLKAWTLPVFAQHGNALQKMIQVFTELTGDEADIEKIALALPAIEASLQSPEMVNEVRGVSEIVDLIEAIFAYNEVYPGLGKAFRLQTRALKEMTTASGETLTPQVQSL